MIDDIAAIQRIYGVNAKTRNTDTTYGFNSNSERDFYSLKDAGDPAIFCVWDGGGTDTLDFSGFIQNQLINLNAESFSDVGALKGNVSIAKGVTLENAVGGAGNDTLIGNQANNRLKGGNGSDTQTGGAGADTFVYDSASDSTPENPDQLMDFTTGVDRIDVSGLLKTAGIKSLNFGALTGRPGDAVLTFNHAQGEGSLSIDLTGNGKADLYVKSKGEIKPADVIAQGGAKNDPEADSRPDRKPKPDPNPNPRNVNTTYGFNSNSGDTASSLTSSSDKPRFRVKDDDGIDTLDFSGFSQSQIIDLHAGSFSDVGGMKANVSIDDTSTIENAVGGEGNDLLIGNHVNNVFRGRGGSDKLWGGGGSDTFVYEQISDSTPEAPDLLMDFTSGTDKIDVSRLICAAGLNKLDFVSVLTGKAGQAVLSYDAQTGMGSLAIDLKGSGKADLLVKTLSEIKVEDVWVRGGGDPEPEPKPKPKQDPKPKPTNDEDTIYGFNSNTNKPHMTLTSSSDKPDFTVNDRSGNDTFDFSGFTQDQIINLGAGVYSSVGGMKENIFITEKTVIENAIGGSGNDRIGGNAEDNILVGGAGADNLTGGGGWNTFKYETASDSTRNSADLLMDFTTGKDKIDLSQMSKDAGVTLNLVDKYTGKAGDTIIKFNPITGRYLLAADLTGSGKTEFLIKSTQMISPEDVIGLTLRDDTYL